MQVIVLGAHRSGTSVTAGLIRMMGFTAGEAEQLELLTPNRENPKGYFERRDVVELNDRILRAMRGNWSSVMGLEDGEMDEEQLEEIRVAIERKTGELRRNKRWFLKDPRMSLTLPFWLEHVEQPIVVHPFRSPVEVALSLRERDQFPISFGMALWEYYVAKAIENSHGLPAVYVSYANILSDPLGAAQRLRDDLMRVSGEEVDVVSEQELRAFVDPSLYRSRYTGSIPGVSDSQTDLYAELERRARGEMIAPPKVSSFSREELICMEASMSATKRSTHRRLGKNYLAESKMLWEKIHDLEGSLSAISDDYLSLAEAGVFSRRRWRAALRTIRYGVLRRTKEVLDAFEEERRVD
ncbi:MAG: sulfotransferase [Verrucomicrobiota bacterium]